ncbi:hypothetical protein QBC39DRAFT_70375 [Podospora conica]|nr:hypothetical protein QBC39DRAFT_70375 [Schizothecium conicum]
MTDEQPQNAESKLSARAAELKQKLVEGRIKSSLERQVVSLEGPVNVDPASIDELIRKNSGMVTPTATDQHTGLLDLVLEQVNSPRAAPPTAKRTGMTKRPSETAPKVADTVIDRVATEPARPVIHTSPEIVMADATNPDKSQQATPAPSTPDYSLARLLEQDEDLKDWLALTNYYDVESRNKKLEVYRERHREKIRKVLALEAQMKQMEAERRKLMEEVEPDMGFMWPTTTAVAAAPVPSSVASTPKPSESTATPTKESTEFKREHFDTVPAKRTMSTIPTEPSYRPEKQARVDAKYSHGAKQTSNHRDQEQDRIDERDGHRKDAHQSTSRPYIKAEDGRRTLTGRESPPRRPRDRSPHGSPLGRRVSTDCRGPRRPDWNEQRGQDNGGYKREVETARRPLGRNGPPTYFDVGGHGGQSFYGSRRPY